MRAKLKLEYVWAKHDLIVWAKKLLMSAWCRIPLRWRHTILCWEIGSLTTEPRLSSEVVGDIRVQALFDTMRDREYPGWDD